jgi:dolichol kinase
MANGEYVEGSYFFYAPSKGAAIFFTVAFFISMLVHGYQCQRYKSWLLSGLWWFCTLLFTAGFAVRVYGAWNYDNLGAYIASTCITYAAP